MPFFFRLPKNFFDKIEQTEVEIISSKGSSAVLLGNHKTEEGEKEEMTKEIRERNSKTSLPTTAQFELSSDSVPKAELVACSSTGKISIFRYHQITIPKKNPKPHGPKSQEQR